MDYKYIVRWIRSYFIENGPNCNAIIGISGGKDSTVAAALCVEALGADRVIGICMPNGEQYDLDVAEDVCKHLGIKYDVINIGDITTAFYKTIGGDSKCYQIRTNTPARIRMAMLYSMAVIYHGRVCCTSNRSEEFVGYSTKWGDNIGDFAPLINLTATEIVRMGLEMGIPEKFMLKKPEDGMTGSTDEEIFGFTYAELDNYIANNTIPNRFETQVAMEMMHKSAEHKRNSIHLPSPPNNAWYEGSEIRF